jgi:hypothetical protein
MESTEIAESMKEAKEASVDRNVAIYIAVMAVFLAICTMAGGNAAKDGTRANIQASDVWAQYQGKTNRQTAYKIGAESLELQLAAQPNMPEAARKLYEGKMAFYRSEAARLDSEPEKGEGKKELAHKARELEHERDIALQRDPYFDFAEALIQIAIVMASAFIVFNNRILMIGSAALGGMGVLLLLNGFMLLVRLPFLG